MTRFVIKIILMTEFRFRTGHWEMTVATYISGLIIKLGGFLPYRDLSP